jgi:hypothetical protein
MSEDIFDRLLDFNYGSTSNIILSNNLKSLSIQIKYSFRSHKKVYLSSLDNHLNTTYIHAVYVNFSMLVSVLNRVSAFRDSKRFIFSLDSVKKIRLGSGFRFSFV